LTALHYDKQGKRLFVSDSIGTLFIYSPEVSFEIRKKHNYRTNSFSSSQLTSLMRTTSKPYFSIT